MPALGLTADTDTYNALIWGCSHYGQNASVPKVGACKAAQSTTSVEILSVKDAICIIRVAATLSHEGGCSQSTGTPHAMFPNISLICCCVSQLLEELRGSGCAPSSKTHELRVDSAIIAIDIPGMLAALQVWAHLLQTPSPQSSRVWH